MAQQGEREGLYAAHGSEHHPDGMRQPEQGGNSPKITTTGRSSGPPLLSTQASAPKNTSGVTQAASREMCITRRLRLVDCMAASLAGLKGGCPGSGGSGASGGSAPV